MTTTKPTTKFWIIASLAILWNLIGVFAFTSQAFISSAALSQLPQEQIELIHNTPQWLTGVFAIATVSGLIGSVLLLLRRTSAVYLFLLSLIGVIIQMGYSVFAMKAIEVYGVVQGLIFPIIVLVVAILLLIYSRRCAKKGLLRKAS